MTVTIRSTGKTGCTAQSWAAHTNHEPFLRSQDHPEQRTPESSTHALRENNKGQPKGAHRRINRRLCLIGFHRDRRSLIRRLHLLSELSGSVRGYGSWSHPDLPYELRQKPTACRLRVHGPVNIRIPKQ